MQLPEQGLLEFPCAFEIKAMGASDVEFESLVVGIVARHVDELAEDASRTRDSRNGRYVSVSVRFLARDREQLHAIYRDLNAHDLVLMVL